uniref:Matrix remodeling associated 5 n=1 Tax=Loxodonta africana TaxID=9785 RepID=G3U0T6_LOXAF
QACPHPCACYVPSEVHCTFRSLASVPAGISKHVERINLGFNSIQAVSETSFAGLTKLELLMVHGNEIPSIPDGALRDLSSLQVFKFSYNKLRVITGQTLRGLSSLVRLHVDHNKIEFIHPQAFHGLMSLRLLHLEGNLLRQLHPGTFSTFSFLDYFRLSTVRHLYLAENKISSLPTGMLQNMPLLENLYLHGNPWACSCEMKWFLEWEEEKPGILKCKKDKAYEGGQLCAVCSSPKKLHKQEIHKLKDIACSKPLIESPLRQNRSGSSEEEQGQEEEDGDDQLSLDSFHLPTWNVSLNMTDEHGNTVDLVCSIKKPTDVYKILLNQTDPLEIEVNATVALDFECPMTRENYEKLWKLIAYYSEVPLKLHRAVKLSKDPGVHYEYRQDADDDALYYTGVKAHILAEPGWVMQPSVDIQLNRRQSTARKVLLSYYTWFSQTMSAKDVRRTRSRSWVMVETSEAMQRAQTVLEGSSFQLGCNVRASESPAIFWVLPDGSVLKAPMEDSESRFSVLSGGQLRIKSAEYSDSGLYHCVAQVTDEMDRIVYRVAVQTLVTQPPGGHTVTITKSPGEPVVLPCSALAIPEAQLSWVLPSKRIMSHLANTSHAYMLGNGTLSIPKVQASDGGYYRCVAVNLQGADHFTVGVTVNKIRGDVIEDEGGSGIGSEDKTPRRVLHPMDQEVFIKTKDEASVGGKKTKKGRRKWKLWKNPEKEPETNVAEGRRAFESRRRINVANKQINPERWADILARVRGRNLPKGTEVTQAVPPPSVSPEQTTTSAEDSSADTSIFNEEEEVLNTISSARIALEHDRDGGVLAEPTVTSMQLEDVLDQEISEKTEDSAPTEADSSVPTQMSLPHESSSPLQILDTSYEEPTYEEVATEGWSTVPSIASVPPPTSKVDELPLDAISLAEAETETYLYPDPKTDSQPAEDKMEDLTSTGFTPTPTWWAVDPRTSEPLGEPDVPAQTNLQGQTDGMKPMQGGLGTQGNSLIPGEGNVLERDPTGSRRPESEELRGMGSLAPFTLPRESTPDTLLARDSITVSMMTLEPKTASPTELTTHPFRKKPNGRKKLRPHRFRHRHKQTPPTTSAPTETFSTRPTQVPEMKVPSKLEMGKPAEPVTKGTPRRKHSKKQNKHRYTTSTVSSTDSLPKTIYLPQNKLKSKRLPQSHISPHQIGRKLRSITMSQTSMTMKLALQPPLSQELTSHHLLARWSPLWKDLCWTSPTTAQPQRVETGRPPSSAWETRTDPPLWKELENTYFPSEFSPSAAISTLSQQGEDAASATVSSVRLESPSSQAETTTRGQDQQKPTLATTHPEIRPQDHASTPGSLKEPAFPFPPTMSMPLVQTTTKFTPLSTTTSQTQTESKENVLLNYETEAPQLTNEGTRYILKPKEVSTPSSKQDNVNFSPKQEFVNKPFVTPKLTTTTTPLPLHRPKPSTPRKFDDRGTNQFNANPKVFGSNNIPDQRSPAGKPPSSRLPHHSNGRFPFFFNRTFVFPQLGSTLKPQTPTTPASVTRERKVNPDSYNRILSQSVNHMDFGPPAPPLLHPPRATVPPSTNAHNIPPVHSTQSSIPFTMSSGQPSRNFHQSSSKLFSIGGLPASKFWMLGEKPQIITKSPQSVFVTAETDAVFPCEATGKPTPFVTWTKVSTGALMTPSTRTQRFEVLNNGTLVIRKVQVQDHGQYLCTAKNLHGVDTMPVLLTVTTQQPQILASHYQDVTVYLGDTIAMECLAKGTPVPQISWIFPDRRVWHTVSPVEGRVTLHENRTLSIKEASFSDRGVYKCVASNAAGADSLAIRLHVAALPPVIHQEKQENISLPPGLSIHIHCTAKAAPLPSVRWVLGDGTQVRPSQFIRGNLFVFPNGTLYIRNLSPKDSGRYECVAANLVGSARRTVQLTVQRTAANARITGTSPRRTDVRYGGTLRLDCSASGDPPRTQWRLPSQRMVDALFSFDPRIKVFANGTLLVKSVTDKDAGDYLCVARNKIGDDYVVLKVNVVMKPAKIEHKENDHKVFYGGDLKVDCVATGLPNPEISWSLPDGSLVNSFMQSDDSGGRTKRYVVFNNGTLYFNEVGMREEGDYTCFAENQVGKDEMTVRVKVVAEPAAIRNKTYSVIQVPYGDVVTVTCEAKGEPTPRVTWLSPTNRLIPASSDKYQVYQDGTLLIHKAQRSDSGNYTCVVRNSAGEDRKVVWIQVQVQPPKINGNRNAITTVREIAAGGSRKLIDCRAEGIPAPKALWAFPEGVVLPAPYYGNRITVHRNGTLDIRNLRKSDSVQFVCIARNEGGEARLIVQLTVLDPVEKPVFHDPVSEKIIAMAGHTISLNCSAAGTPAPTLVWVLPNGTELQGGRQLQRFYHKSDGRLHISSLSSADAGAYRCVARNSAGYSERLVSLKVGLRPGASSQHQHVVTIINGETLQLPCLIQASRPARFSWTLPNGMVLEVPQEVGRFALLENGTLTVHEASVFDRGTYTCKADTEYGPSVMSVPVIVIAYPPRITSEATPVIYARPGSTVKINCLAMGIPKAQITWELPDKSHLTAGTQARIYGNKFLQPQGSLTIQQASPRDAGFYKCTAKNILGRDSKTTYIHVF